MSSLVLALLPLLAVAQSDFELTRSAKRGLCFTPNEAYPEDNAVWVQDNSDLTWYYNYEPLPSTEFSTVPQDKFEFVPMMFGVFNEDIDDVSFLNSVKGLVEEQGVNITHVLGFNEPDAGWEVGGSNMTPEDAAHCWVLNFPPLQEMGIKVGLPAMTGAPDGLDWLLEFLDKCAEKISEGEDERRNCTFDFVPIHWYDNFEGIASHIGQRRELFPDADIWVTEYAYAWQPLEPTQWHYNITAEYFDRLDYVTRYSYFGAFRSHTSNVGPNAAFLNNDGVLTDIGSWFLGFPATGVDPQSGEVDGAVSLGRSIAAVLGMAAVSLMVVLS